MVKFVAPLSLSATLSILLVSCGGGTTTNTPTKSNLPTLSVGFAQNAPFQPLAQLSQATSGLTMSYSVNGKTTKQLSFGTETSQPLVGACPGSNTLAYSLSTTEQTGGQQSASFTLPTDGAFSIEVLPGQLVAGSQQSLHLLLHEQAAYDCEPAVKVVSASNLTVGTFSVAPSDQGRVITLPVQADKAGSYSLQVEVTVGGAVQSLTVPVIMTEPQATTGTVTGMTLDKTQVEVTEGQTLQLGATLQGLGTFDPGLTFTSDQPDIAKVTQAGVVTGIKAGKAQITVASSANSAVSGVVTVTVKPLGSFSLAAAPDTTSVYANETGQLLLSMVAADGYNGNVTLSAAATGDLSASFGKATLAPGEQTAVTLTPKTTQPGSYPITITASDGTRSSTKTLTLVIKAPETVTDAPPVINSSNLMSTPVLLTAPFTVQVNAQDDQGVASVIFSVNGVDTLKLTSQGGNLYSGNWDFSKLSNGPQNVAIAVTDTKGQTVTWQGTVTVSQAGSGMAIINRFPLTGMPTTPLMFDSTAAAGFIGTSQGVFRINLADGTTASVALPDGTPKTLALQDGFLYALSGSGVLYVIDSGTLKIVNQYPLPGSYTAKFAQGAAGLFLGSDAGLIQVTQSGLKNWGGGRITSIAVGVNVYAVAASAAGSTLSVFDSQGNKLSSKSDINLLNVFLGESTGTLYGGDFSGTALYKFDLSLNSQVIPLKNTLEGQIATISEVGNQIYVADRGGVLSTTMGDKIALDNPVAYSMAFRDNTLYVGTDGGSLYSFAVDGTQPLKESYSTRGLGSLSAPLVFGPNGNLYYVSLAKTIDVFRVK